MDESVKTFYVICVDNDGYPASLERRKVYEAFPDPEAESHHLIRVVDESGEDYLYPMEFFESITLTHSIAQKAFALEV
jgi:Ca2+-binding EF-hand superfamily protein